MRSKKIYIILVVLILTALIGCGKKEAQEKKSTRKNTDVEDSVERTEKKEKKKERKEKEEEQLRKEAKKAEEEAKKAEKEARKAEEEAKKAAEEEARLKEETYKSLVEEIKQYMGKGEYETALEKIEMAMIEYEDRVEELESLKESCNKSILESMISEADSFMVESKYNEAYNKLEEAVTWAGSDEKSIRIIGERKIYYNTYLSERSRNLMAYKAYDYNGANGYGFSNTARDTYTSYPNNSYSSFIMFMISQGNNSGARPYVEYELNKEWTRLEATIVVSDKIDTDKAFHMEIYSEDPKNGGKLLYTTETIRSNSEPLTFSVDITDVNIIHIACIREDHNLTFCAEQPSMAIVSLAVHNDNVEFEYYADKMNSIE